VTAVARRCVVCHETYAGDERFCPRDGGAIVDADHDAAADPLVGRTIDGRYVIRRVIGRGGMGTVYAADHVGLDRTVAVKLASRNDADDTTRARFRREARAASRVAHPNVVQVLDFGSWDSADYLVMELVTGRTLSAVLHDGPLPPARAVAIARALLDALAAIHGAGIVHRDVKPANVLLSDGEVVKLMDFGIAKTAGGATLTGGDQAVGTPAYMAPEQLLGDVVDGRADIYAVGVTLFAMLLGDVPFGQTAFTRVALRHLHEPPPLDALPPGVPAPVVAALARALAKAPADRFADAGAFAAALSGGTAAPVAEPASDGEATVADRPSAARPPERRSSARRAPTAAIAAVAAPFVAVAAYFVYDAIAIERAGVAPVDAPRIAPLVVDAAAHVADDQLQLARDAENRGDREQAIAAYREVYAARPGADPLYRIADLEDRLGRNADAARDLRRYLDAVPGAADRDRVMARIAALDPPSRPTPQSPPAAPPPARRAIKHHCLCAIVPPGNHSWQGACAKVGTTGSCRCLNDFGGQICLDPPVACGSGDNCYEGFRCARLREPGHANLACSGTSDDRPPTNHHETGTYACNYCPAEEDHVFHGNDGEPCVGYQVDTGERRDGKLAECE
jgi:tRNA A-37 threonylcarbamoyl transferase component Bud32